MNQIEKVTGAPTRIQASDDPDVVRILESMSQMRHERDGLRLDLAQRDRALAAADAKIDYLEHALATMTQQRDAFMGKLIETATHHAAIHDLFDKADKALSSVAVTGKAGNGGTAVSEQPKRNEPGELLSDNDARKIAEKYAPRPQ